MSQPSSHHRTGLMLAVAAYVIWGFLPLFFRMLHHVPAVELVGWRVVFTLPLCLAIVAARGQAADVRAALADRAVLLRLCASALLIGANWLLYVIAINNGHVLAASLGYYINPLLNVLLGTLLLGERLTRTQWTAVAIAGLGIALALAVSFALYGLVRKLTPVGSVPGLTIETSVLYLPAIAVVAWQAHSPAGSSLGQDAGTTIGLAASGVVTAVPLLLFAVAARRLDLSTLGFVQFLSPTLAFLLGIFVFDEPLDPVRLACFVLIWTAIALFSWDMLRRRQRAPA
ncbi:EamA family transporter RarD [Novosphingobium sp. EMRT-2]|uniref:EamA family transporter RarD n=1 Tax=Novosphingobium sp. EMRT-2 TaxID=2571749 RepID=UPI0010BDA635|nr:EamA family transporter RarD [Novosphingobium sp. EMRT-2]QCI94641.1 EamA family transporter RarD [Novosphingobium sp. EMRT-2]